MDNKQKLVLKLIISQPPLLYLAKNAFLHEFKGFCPFSCNFPRYLLLPLLFLVINIGTSGCRCSRSPFRRSTGNDVSGPLFSPFFSFLFSFFSFIFSVVYFSHRRSARIKNLFSESWRESPKTKGWPFRIFEGFIEGMIESNKLGLSCAKLRPASLLSLLLLENLSKVVHMKHFEWNR